MQTDRAMPYDDGAERAVIGSILLEPYRVLPLLLTSVPADAFYVPAHRTIVETILAMASGGPQAVDTITLSDRLRESGQLEAVGGYGALERMQDATPTAAHAEFYLEIVRQKKVARELITCGYEQAAAAFTASEPDKLIPEYSQRLLSLAAQEPTDKSNAECIAELIEKWRQARSGGPKAIGLPLPWDCMTEMISGLEPGLTILAGRPSQGKTTVEDCIAVNLAEAGIPVGRITLDATRGELMARALARGGLSSLPRLKQGRGSDSNFERIERFGERLGKLPMYFEDRKTEIGQLAGVARAWKARHGIQLLTLDYLQQVKVANMSGGRYENPVQIVSHVTSVLKALALELGIPVLALSQLSRAADKEGREPQLTDLRDSGAIEQDAHKVLMVYRDVKRCEAMDGAVPGWTKNLRPTWLGVVKQKDGELGRIPFWMRPNYFMLFPADDETFAPDEQLAHETTLHLKPAPRKSEPERQQEQELDDFGGE